MQLEDNLAADGASLELTRLVEQGGLVEKTGIQTLSDLVLVEEYLDSVEGGLLARTSTYDALQQDAQRFLRARPEVLCLPWVRNGGAVYDLVATLREQMGLRPALTARVGDLLH